MDQTNIPRPLTFLGLSGLAPQAVCLGIAALSQDWYWVALAAGYFYAAIILSFLGGLWWMQALERNTRGAAIYIVAVLPSLIAWASLLPWCLGWAWPGPSLVGLSLCLAASPLIDRALAQQLALASQWLRLRLVMALGLPCLTFFMSPI